MKYCLFLLGLIVSEFTFSQVDTSYLKSLYDHSLDLAEDKLDSINYYADFIARESARLHFNKGDVLSLRLKGIYEDLGNNYEKALGYYLQSLDAARKLQAPEYEECALSDLAILYANIRQPQKAKEFYLQSAELSERRGKVSSLVNTYTNLAVIYSQIGQTDSARHLLNKAIELGTPFEPRIDLSAAYNNLGTIYFKEKNYNAALASYKRNAVHHTGEDNLGDLWTDVLNIAEVYIEQHRFDSGAFYADYAMRLANQLSSKSKEADSYAMMAKLARYLGNYQAALQYQEKWYSLDTALINSESYTTVATLQERFNAKEREAENKLLQERIKNESVKTKGITLLAIALGVIVILALTAFIIKRNANRRLKTTNDLIVQQNEKLSELNYEKNSLISIVSHDLNTPFATIQIWSELLKGHNADQLSGEQKRALDKILQASSYGEELIRRILNVEKADIGNHKMQLENFDMTIFAEEVVDNFRAVAARKDIRLHTEIPGKKMYLLSDRQLVSRICENLLSNAIKYTPPGKNVWISINEEQDAISIKVRDEGVGIEKDELPYLFSKYSKISSQPTEGEFSTGLGLSIVKRIVEEINGKIFCESEPGKGSLFTVILKK